MTMHEQTIGAFLDSVAAKSPTPGGGAVAAAVGALSAALAGMVVSYSIGKKNLAEHQVELNDAAAKLTRARGLMLALAAEDEQAYGVVNELMKLPEGDARRVAEVPAAALAATQAPLSVMATACDLLRLFERLAAITNRHLRSDLAIAAVLGDAVCRAGRWNVAINLPMLRELGLEQGAAIERTCEELLAASGAMARSVEEKCR
ncbi:MAG: cyclodeaminase/cyclohydrolase family protein [Phycisphaerales bacterium]